MNWTQQTDGQLVGAFASSGAEAAFAELIRRHATMVFRTCRRVTASHQDAEDATQAVFATVIVRARDLSTCPSLGGWLYSAAWQSSYTATSGLQGNAIVTQIHTTVPEPATISIAIGLVLLATSRRQRCV